MLQRVSYLPAHDLTTCPTSMEHHAVSTASHHRLLRRPRLYYLGRSSTRIIHRTGEATPCGSDQGQGKIGLLGKGNRTWSAAYQVQRYMYGTVFNKCLKKYDTLPYTGAQPCVACSNIISVFSQWGNINNLVNLFLFTFGARRIC